VDKLHAPVRPDRLQEFHAGVAFWRTKIEANWPADFHNADYKVWASENRDFSDARWKPFLRRLHDWIAIRPATYAEVTERFLERRDTLPLVWETNCAPFRELDITGVTWAQVGGFADLVGEIKPMKGRGYQDHVCLHPFIAKVSWLHSCAR
jgi:hypothetical protein